MRASRAALALAVALAAGGCLQDPKGRCDTTAECRANEACEGGVCVRVVAAGGDGSGGGLDPTTFTPVTWSTVVTSASAAFGPASLSADPTSGDLVVAGGLEGRHDAWTLTTTTAFAARLSGASGALTGPVATFPTFSHAALRTATLASGELLFAGVAVDPTVLGTHAFTPPAGGSLLLGKLDAAGAPLWALRVDAASGTVPIAPVAVASRGGDLVVAGTGAGDFGSGAATAGATFAARLSGVDGACVWAQGFPNQAVSDAEVGDAGDVALAGLCRPTGASFDPGGGSSSCTTGLYVAVLSGADGTTRWARTSSGAGTVSAVRDVSVAPDGGVALVGDGRGVLSLAGAGVDLGTTDTSFAAALAPTGTARWMVHPTEAPYAPLPDAASFDRCAYDRSGRLWVAGRYYGQPTVGGVRFSRCRDTCTTAAYLARLDGATSPTVGSFLPIRIGESPSGAAFADDLVLSATTGTVGLALRFSGDATVGSVRWRTDAAGLAALRLVP